MRDHLKKPWRAWLPDDLEPRERRLLRLHLASALLSGVSVGILHLADTILAKTLGGSALEVTALSMLMGLGFVLTLHWGGVMQNRPKAPFILAAGVCGRLGMSLIGLWSHPLWFIFIGGLGWMGQAMIVTAQVSVIQQAYRPGHRNQLFGLSVSVATATRLLATVLAGHLLDWKEDSYGLIFAVAGTCGLLGAVLLAWMEEGDGRREPATAPANLYRPLEEPASAGGWRTVGRSAGVVLRVLRDNRPFRQFEINFFIYGIAFLSLLPIVPLFLVHDLELDYTQIGLARGLMGQAGLILLPPVLGRTLEVLKPVRFCARVFAFLTLYPTLLLLAVIAPGLLRVPLVYAAFLAFGVAMAGISLAWSMSSLHFAGEDDPSTYQSAHSLLVGIRGVLAPLLGFLIIHTTSNAFGFVFSSGLFCIAALLMTRMAQRSVIDDGA